MDKKTDKKNSFEKIDEYKAPLELKEKTYRQTEGSISFIRLIFNVLDLYITKALDALVETMKDDSSTESKKKDDSDPKKK